MLGTVSASLLALAGDALMFDFSAGPPDRTRWEPVI